MGEEENFDEELEDEVEFNAPSKTKHHGGITDSRRSWMMERGMTVDPKTGARLGITGKVGSKEKHEQNYLKYVKGRIMPYIFGPPRKTVGRGPVSTPSGRSFAYIFPWHGEPGKAVYGTPKKAHGGIADSKRSWLMERGRTYDPKSGIRLGITGKVGSQEKHEQDYLKHNHKKQSYIQGPPKKFVGKGPVDLPVPDNYAYVFPKGTETGRPKILEDGRVIYHAVDKNAGAILGGVLMLLPAVWYMLNQKKQ